MFSTCLFRRSGYTFRTPLTLDAVMHSDAHPWAPVSSVNPFVGLLSVDELNALCLGSLLVGVLLMGTQKVRKMRNGSAVTGGDR